MKVLFWKGLRRENPGIHLCFGFEPRDVWVGVYWTPRHDRLEVYVCLVPMFPAKLSVLLEKRRLRRMREGLGIIRPRRAAEDAIEAAEIAKEAREGVMMPGEAE